MRGIWGLAAVALLLTTGAVAQDRTQFMGDGAFAVAPSMASDNGMTSMKGNANVKIGGDVLLMYAWSSMGKNVPTNPTFGSRYYGSEWFAKTLDLDFEIKACDNITFFMALDLTDPWYTSDGYTQDELVDHAYLMIENIGGSNFGLKAGKMRAPFGMEKDELALSPYLAATPDSYLDAGRNGIGGYAGSREYDRVFALAPFVNVTDSFKLEGAIFQQANGRANTIGGSVGGTSGGYTDDPGVSFAGRATWAPIEDLKLYASAYTMYDRKAKNEKDDFNTREWATSLGADYTFGNFNVFAEWQHTWHYAKSSRSDDIYAGVSYAVSECIKLFAQFEYLRTGTAARFGAPKDWDYFRRGYLAAQYSFGNGAHVEAGYQREWWKNNGQANVLYAALGFSF